jgi:hypothetical protein
MPGKQFSLRRADAATLLSQNLPSHSLLTMCRCHLQRRWVANVVSLETRDRLTMWQIWWLCPCNRFFYSRMPLSPHSSNFVCAGHGRFIWPVLCMCVSHFCVVLRNSCSAQYSSLLTQVTDGAPFRWLTASLCHDTADAVAARWILSTTSWIMCPGNQQFMLPYLKFETSCSSPAPHFYDLSFIRRK